MDENEMYEQDRDRAIGRAEDLMMENPALTAQQVIEILDDEFRGSCCYPGASTEIIAAVDNVWLRTRPITG